jgi:hypothetical protein
MQFVYDKEFVAQRSAQADQAVADLYRTRGLSTDTAVEAGYVVYLGLGVMKSLSPDRPVRRVLIVGPVRSRAADRAAGRGTAGELPAVGGDRCVAGARPVARRRSRGDRRRHQPARRRPPESLPRGAAGADADDRHR